MTIQHVQTVEEIVADRSWWERHISSGIPYAAAKRVCNSEPTLRLQYALQEDTAAAEEIIRQYGITACSPEYPEGSTTTNLPLMERAVGPNNKSFPDELYVVLYRFLRDREPDSLHMKAEGGGNLLHAWANQGGHLSVLQDLLNQGINPLAKDDKQQTPLDIIQKQLKKHSLPQGWIDYFQTAEHLLVQKMQDMTHSPATPRWKMVTSRLPHEITKDLITPRR